MNNLSTHVNHFHTVPFHGTALYVVEHNGQPYTPMKPIVEGMGLAWQPQLHKLSTGAKRWGITKIVIPTNGDFQEMVCLPLRKLFGWLNTISPNKIRKANKAEQERTRQTVVMYQNECDDALWDYWTKGIAVNKSDLAEPPMRPAVGLETTTVYKQNMRALAQLLKMMDERFSEMYELHDQSRRIFTRAHDVFRDANFLGVLMDAEVKKPH